MNEIEFYNNISQDPNSTPQQRSLADAMKTKARINAAITGWGVPSGAAVGGTAGHPFLGGVLAPQLSRVNNWLWDKGLAPAMQQYNVPMYQQPVQNKTVNNQVIPAVNQGGRTGCQTPSQLPLLPQGIAEVIGTEAPQSSDTVAEKTPQLDARIVNDYISQLQDRNAPYVRSLEDYLKKYPQLLKQSGRNDLYFYGANLAYGLDPRAGQRFDSVKNYKDMINLIKEIQAAKNADVDYANEVAGNLAIATNELGLPPETAFANKNLLTMLAAKDRENTKMEIAIANNLTRRYGIDKNYARALAVQAMRGNTALDVARINAAAYGNGVAPGLNAQGGIAPQKEMSMAQALNGNR